MLFEDLHSLNNIAGAGDEYGPEHDQVTERQDDGEPVHHMKPEEPDDQSEFEEGIYFAGCRWLEVFEFGYRINNRRTDKDKGVASDDGDGEPDGYRWKIRMRHRHNQK